MENSYSLGSCDKSTWNRYYQPNIQKPSDGKKSATVQTSINSTQFRVRTRLENNKIVGEQKDYWQQVMDIAGRVLDDLQCAPEQASTIQTLRLDKNGLHVRYLNGKQVEVRLNQHEDLPVQYQRLQALVHAKRERAREVKQPGSKGTIPSRSADEPVFAPRTRSAQQYSDIDPGILEKQMQRSEQMAHHFIDTLTKQQELSAQERAQFTDGNQRLFGQVLQSMQQHAEQLEHLTRQGSLNSQEERKLTNKLVNQQGELIRQIYELLSKEKSSDVKWDPLLKALHDLTKDMKGWQDSSRADVEKLTQMVSDKENIAPFNPEELLDQHTRRLAEIIQLLVKPVQETSSSDHGTTQQVKDFTPYIRAFHKTITDLKKVEAEHETRIEKLERKRKKIEARTRTLQEEIIHLKIENGVLHQEAEKLKEAQKKLDQAQDDKRNLEKKLRKIKKRAQQEFDQIPRGFHQRPVEEDTRFTGVPLHLIEDEMASKAIIKELKKEVEELKKEVDEKRRALKKVDELQPDNEQLVTQLRNNKIDINHPSHRFAFDMVRSFINREKEVNKPNSKYIESIPVNLPTDSKNLDRGFTTVHIPNDTRSALELSKICGISETTMRMILALCDPDFTCNWATKLSGREREALTSKIARRESAKRNQAERKKTN